MRPYLLAIFTNFPSKNMPPTQVTGTEYHLVLKSTHGKEQNQCRAEDSAAQHFTHSHLRYGKPNLIHVKLRHAALQRD